MSTSLIPERPSFVDRDPAVIEAAIIAELEEDLGRVLQPAQVEAVLARVLAYRETLVRIAIQDAAEQNLVAFARAPMLDFLGELVGAIRIPAKPAETTLRFTLAGVQAEDVLIPAGTRVQSANGKMVFATAADMTIAAGAIDATVLASAATPGEIGNGFAPGSVVVILDPVAFVASASNDDVSADGSETESDDAYRLRIKDAPNQFSVAGSVGAYRFHAFSVSALIIDVAVTSPEPGEVLVTLLTSDGAPSPELIAAVQTALSGDTVRPLTDTVDVEGPTEVNYAIDATVRVLTGADQAATLAAALAAAQAYAADRAGGLGRDIVLSQLVAALSVPGVYQVTLALPAADIVVAETEWANSTGVAVALGAPAEG